MLWKPSISRRLTWLNVMVSATALAITAVALIIYDQSSFRRSLVDNLSAQANVVGKNSVSSLVFADPETAASTLSALDSVPNIVAASLFRTDGKLFASYSRTPSGAIAQMDSKVPAREQFTDQGLLLTRELLSGNKVVGYLVIKADTSGIHQRLKSYLLIVGGVLGLSLLAAILLSSAFRRAVARPIVELANSARFVSRKRDYSVRVPEPGTGDELSVLVDAFNEMLSGIQSRDSDLEKERARLRAVLESAPVGIMVADPVSQRVALTNRTADEILQEPAGATGNTIAHWQVMRPNRELVPLEQRPMARALRGEVVTGEEYIIVRSDGSEIWVRSSAVPVREKDGHIAAGLVAVVDIESQKKAQEALLQAEKLAAAGRLAASISHEINNPLESVTNLLFLALSQDLPPDVRQFLTEADQELKRVTHIATQTLKFYRQSTKPTSADMGALIDSVLQLLTGRLRNMNVEVERRYDARTKLTCFEGELRQVFTNLISNAIDAMPRRGARLIVATKEVKVSSGGQAGIQITIADNGHGILAGQESRIFEPFYTTKGSRGTGLGLWVSREIIAKHKGAIRVRSVPERGTVFVIVIPFKGASEQSEDSRFAQLA
ncbi:MAG TPA: ATP-binding protein [Terriglobales bacterium]|nr:ATP-binding protein [Terriglobales bacterium]